MNVQFSLSASGSAGGQLKTDISGTSDAINNLSPTMYTKEVVDLNGKVSLPNEQLIKTIERAVQSLQGPQTTLEISVHEKTHDIMVKVLNKDTGELIREIPREKTLDLVAKMMELAGILVDEKI